MLSFSSLLSLSLAVTSFVGSATLVEAGHLDARSGSRRAHDSRALQKRFSGTATYYITGLGACGIYNQPGDYIVALNSAQYGGGYPGPQCFKSIRITARGKSAVAQITDECPTCGYGDLDFSQGLFEHFANTNEGVFQMSWEFIDGNGGGGNNNDDKEDEDKKWKSIASVSSKSAHSVWAAQSEESAASVAAKSAKSEESERSQRSDQSIQSLQSVASVSSASLAAATTTAVSTDTTSAASTTPTASETASIASKTESADGARATHTESGDTIKISNTNSQSSTGNNLGDMSVLLVQMANLVTAGKGQ
ncbi:hypothetical protein FRC02_012245 [Tulasnella sp. 418]|nr:hypothetical protein FRC02_012245 [Tulasnella sp. 418]